MHHALATTGQKTVHHYAKDSVPPDLHLNRQMGTPEEMRSPSGLDVAAGEVGTWRLHSSKTERPVISQDERQPHDPVKWVNNCEGGAEGLELCVANSPGSKKFGLETAAGDSIQKNWTVQRTRERR